jgi:site-specific recombinase XerD
MKHLESSQVQALLGAAESDRNRLFLSVIYQHGLRVSEALALTRGSVKRGYLQIKAKKNGKRADERMNPSTLALWDKVTEHLCPGTLLFPFSRQWGSEIFHAAAAKAGIVLQLRQGVHSLRHSLAHHMLDSGASLPVVQKALRHRSIGSTGVYLEADGRDVDSWRAKAIGGPAPESTSLTAIRAEIQRLSELALAMQAAQDTTKPVPVTARVTDVASLTGA